MGSPSEKGIEAMKEHVYDIEGWNRDSGHPTRKTLDELDLKYVADYPPVKREIGLTLYQQLPELVYAASRPLR